MNTEAIKEIQHALRTFSFVDASIPRLTVDGRYGYDTKRAVTRFQTLQRLPVTGDVDSATWERLKQVYRDLTASPPMSLDVFPHKTFVLNVGDSNDSVPIIKHVLNVLSDRYENLPYAGEGRIYDTKAGEAVRVLRQLHALGDDPSFDSSVWNLIVTLYNSPFGGVDAFE